MLTLIYNGGKYLLTLTYTVHCWKTCFYFFAHWWKIIFLLLSTLLENMFTLSCTARNKFYSYIPCWKLCLYSLLLSCVKTLIYMAPWVHIEYSAKNVLQHLWKHYCFINLKTYVERQYFGLGIQTVSIFLYIGTLGDMAIQNCQYHIVPRPRKWGLNIHLIPSLLKIWFTNKRYCMFSIDSPLF